MNTIKRVTYRPGATPFHSRVITIEWTDPDGREHIETGSPLNPLIHSLVRQAQYQGIAGGRPMTLYILATLSTWALLAAFAHVVRGQQ